MTSPPTILTNGAINTIEGSASIANSAGTILFYTNGVTVYNQSNAVMANGTGLAGHPSTTQSALIVKKPGSSSIYYIFTLGAYGAANLSYSIVDMTLAGGSGSVTAKNILISTNTAEKLTATKHCNGVDIWVVTHDNYNDYRSYLVTSSGVNTNAIVSTIGMGLGFTNYGCMKISQNGKKLVSALYSTSAFEIFDFDNATGVISNSLVLTTYTNGPYGCEFSPDGTKLYGTLLGGGNLGSYLLQWNLCAGSPTAISASQFTVSNSNVVRGSLQVANDGKIYVARTGQSVIGVINNPNLLGSSCNYVDLGQSVSTATCMEGLPNFVCSSFIQRPPAGPFTYMANNNIGCKTAIFSSSVASTQTISGCSISGFSVVGFSWNFGDPMSGSANSSTLSNPSHIYPSLGSYTTQLIIYYSCGGGTDTLTQQVVINQSCISILSNSITCSNLGTATAIASAGVGPYTYTWLPTNQTNSVASGLNPGTHTVMVFDAGTNQTSSITTNFVSPIPLSGNLNNTPSITCNGASTGTANYSNIAGGSANQNYLWTNGLQTYTTPNISTLSAGLWSSTVTDALTGCQINNVFLILQPPALTLNLAPSSPTACAGSTLSLASSLNGGTPAYSLAWALGQSAVAQVAAGNTTLSEAVAGTYVYTLNAQDSYSCGITQTVSVNFIANPVLNILNVSICPLETGTLNVSGATSYTWSNNSVGTTFTDSPASTSAYSVIGSALGCTSQAAAYIILKATPNPVINSNSPVCENSTFTLSSNTGTAFVWAGANSFSSFSSFNSISNVFLSQAGVYNLTVTAVNSCTGSTSHTVVVKPLPTLTLSTSAASICLNTNSATLFASGTATLFNWLPNQNISSNTSASVVASPTVTKTYTLTGSLNGCSVLQYQTVNVIAPPSLSLALSSNSFCAQAFNGSPNTITLTSSGATSYTLSTPNHFNNPYPSGPASPINLMPPYVNTGPATATLFGSNGVCTVSMTSNFSVIPNPTVSVANPIPVICAGQSYTYTSNGASSYVWSSANPGNTLYTTGNVAVANPSINAVFSVFGGSLGCNSALQTTTLTVNPLPTVEVTPNPTFVCIGNSTELFAKSNGTTFTWSPNNQTGQSATVAPLAQQVYTVVASLNNCTQSAMATVSVMALPIPTIVNTEPVICMGKQITLNGFGGVEYTWQGPAHFLAYGSETKFTPLTLNFAGVYSLTVMDAFGCYGTSTTTINLESLPEGSILYNQKQGCVPLLGNYSFSNPIKPNERIAGIYWTLNDKVVSTNSPNFKYSFTEAGNYKLSAFVKGVNTCDNQFIINVNVFPKPVADFTFTPNKPVESLDVVQFFERSEGADRFSWFISLAGTKTQGTAGGKTLFESQQQNPSYLFENAGTFPIVLVASNKWDCADTIIKTINVEPDFGVYVPNAFTPNGDGKNEKFVPVLRGIKFFTFSIYNRWGQKLFESSDLTNGWDGTYNGLDCKQDVYTWTLNVSTISNGGRTDSSAPSRNDSGDGEAKVYMGLVTLYR